MQLIKSRKLKNNGYKLTFSGELTIFNATALKNELVSYLEQSKALTLDFSDVSEADTALLQILIQIKRECVKQQIDLSITSCSEPIAALLRSFRLTSDLNINQLN